MTQGSLVRELPQTSERDEQLAGLGLLLSLSRPEAVGPATGTVPGSVPGSAVPVSEAPPDVLAPPAASRPARLRRLAARVPALPLAVVLAAQATLSLRLVWSNTAFQDEALYLRAGRLEWAHFLHGAPVPPFPTFFSGAPVIYPPLGALADAVGGLAGARILSLCFMLCATALLCSATSRLFDRRAGFFAAALWAVLGPTLHLGAFATFDAMSLCLIALAVWFVVRAGTARDASAWMIAAALALSFANATAYSSAVFDPVVIALAALIARPEPGGKDALRRSAAVLTFTSAAVALLAAAGGPYYAAGVSQTVLSRISGNNPPLAVLAEAWTWTGVVIVPSLAALLIAFFWKTGRARRQLLLVLVGAALLVPVEQARIHTLTSLDKHADVGAWFAAIAAGYAVSAVIARLPGASLRVCAGSAATAALVIPAILGFGQARTLYEWPNASRFIAVFRPIADYTTGRILIETPSIAEYYLNAGSDWRRWSNTRSIILPTGHTISVHVGEEGNPATYSKYIRRGYFSIVALNFLSTTSLDLKIAAFVRLNHHYQIIASVPYGVSRYVIWRYER